MIIRREYIRSGIFEELDSRQQRLLKIVLDAIKYYYQKLYRTSAKYDQPLSLSMLMQLTNRSGSSVLSAVRILANTIENADTEPPIHYDRVSARNGAHRPYRIFLKSHLNISNS
jgi:hypothetical protein